MIFNSLFNLIETDTDGVYKFICRIFFETDADLSIEERLYILAMVKKFKNEEEKDFDHFIKLFENKKNLLRVFNQFAEGEQFNFFINGKDVASSELKEVPSTMAYFYLGIFGEKNLQNADEQFLKKIS